MRLEELQIAKIDVNEKNPRGVNILTNDPKLAYLKDSIKRFGVMVPLVVTPRRDRFLLIDGERRYYAAKAVGLGKLPAYIIENANGQPFSDRDLLFRMFQIHHLREQWGPVQQCAALQSTYDEIVSRKDIRSVVDLRSQVQAVTEELAVATGIDERTAWDRVKFLRWPVSVRGPMYKDPDPEGYWYICEIEEKIILPSLVNYPEYFELVSADEVREDLFKKLHSALERSTEVRKVAPFFKHVFKKSSEKKLLWRTLDHLRKQPEMTYSEAEDELTRSFPHIPQRGASSPKKLLTQIRRLDSELGQFDVSQLAHAGQRGTARAGELRSAAESLRSSLGEFLGQLSARG
ncbi:MAG: ParB N-terminal domain-containing protein [Bryobacteraceae bacterium]|jgi:hypothetical protein